MYRAVISVMVAGLAVAVSATAVTPSPPAVSPPHDPAARAAPGTKSADDRLIVHEWGTFTSFSGSDGVQLDFRPLLDQDLPPFVLDRAMQAGLESPFSIFLKARTRARQRMETPVTYFYTNTEREVHVRVGFPQGLLTDFYPPVKQMQPAFDMSEPTSIGDSLLDWGTVRLIPNDAAEAGPVQQRLPTAKGENHYFHARDTDSAFVHVRRKSAFAPRPSSDHYEKFLFYRGIGNFTLPLSMKALGKGRFEVTNSGHHPIRSLFLVTVEQKKKIRFTRHEGIDPGEKVRLVRSESPATIEDLSAAVVQELVGAGLYEKEAEAMVATWKDSWFEEDGTRLFYILPQQIVDAMLPLHVEPKPDKTVRVMVGRYEIMTPEIEQMLTAQLKLLAKLPPVAGKPAVKQILQSGRFAEPALVRIHHVSESAAVRQQATALLLKLRSNPNLASLE